MVFGGGGGGRAALPAAPPAGVAAASGEGGRAEAAGGAAWAGGAVPGSAAGGRPAEGGAEGRRGDKARGRGHRHRRRRRQLRAGRWRGGGAKRRRPRQRLGLARRGSRGLGAAQAPLPHWARKQKPRRHWPPCLAIPAHRFDKPGMERRRLVGEGAGRRGWEGEFPSDSPAALPWRSLLAPLIGRAVSPWWQGRLRAQVM
ncbi:uncharacterized PE-PGRS family protein PE_PGRS3-like [Aquila chrysaetos chrysaetos]|uniref:uncharacterized PE-PGRS family protein PE_PGRS3-like n=1 Tax=Aquila chrysaetos chrysaetos TaxID=223781 RepID=UPI001B7D3627|nr:uncharacterized PE-PGRS family protein PE_PGRS3-like [Aquila chrysaetos chrysaetos]